MNVFKPLAALAMAIALGLAGPAVAAPLGLPSSTPPAAPAGPVHLASDGGDCGWFAIAASSRSFAGAQRAAGRVGGWVVDSDDIPEFTPGLYVAVIGPDDRGIAQRMRNRMRSSGYGDAYVKFGCRY